MKTKPEVIKVSKLSDKLPETFIESGITQLDAILGGGFCRGRLTEISGKEAVGKTYLVSKLMANLSKDHKVLFVDAEFSANRERIEALGADSGNIDYIADSRLEQVAELINASIGKYDVIILDSLASLIPLTVENQAVGESSNIGLFSRLIKQFVMAMRPRLGKSNTALIVINQMRKSLNMYQPVELPGGMAFAHVCDVRIRLSTVGTDKILKGGVRVGHTVHAEATKNKVAPPFVKTQFDLLY